VIIITKNFSKNVKGKITNKKWKSDYILYRFKVDGFDVNNNNYILN